MNNRPCIVKSAPAAAVMSQRPPVKCPPLASDTFPRYALFALTVLTLANVLNYFDRLILPILAEDLKVDLHLDDAESSFLLVTAFAALALDLLVPRRRGSGPSALSLGSIVVATGAGPYWAGKVSVITGSLVTGLISVQILVPLVMTALAYRHTFAR